MGREKQGFHIQAREVGLPVHVTVDQSDLGSALQAVGRAVAGRTTLPALSGVHLQARDGLLVLTATDLELTIRARIPARVGEPGEAVLPARYLAEFVRRVPSGEIALAVDPARHSGTLRWGRSEHTIHGFPPADFPAAPPAAAGDGLRIDAASLRKALRRTGFAVSSDDSKPALTGVWLRLEGGALAAIGCDGYRVAMCQLPLEAQAGALDAVVPGRAVAELGRLLGDAGEVALSVREQQLFVEIGPVQLTTRLIDAPYPNVPQILPRDYPHRLTLELEALVEAAERIAPLAEARRTARWLVVLEPQPDALVLHAHDPDIGEAREEVPAAYEGEPFRLGLNVRYLLDALRHMEGESLEVGLIGPTGPVRLRSPEDPGCEHVIYPIRL